MCGGGVGFLQTSVGTANNVPLKFECDALFDAVALTGDLRDPIARVPLSDAELAEKMSQSRAGRISISADIQREIASLVKGGDS